MAISLETELMALRRDILAMGSLVEQRVGDAIDALFAGNYETARCVRVGDSEIDAMDVDIESECVRILALSHPVASDLRLVLSVLRINTDLERIGDEAKSIAKRVLDLQEADPLTMPEALREMAGTARRMLAEALTALAEGDAELCRHVRRSDQQVDDLLKGIFTWIQEEIPRHVEATRAAIDVLSIARRFERIADLSTNIAEDVIFLLEGTLVRHQR